MTSSHLHHQISFNQWANQQWIEMIYGRDPADQHLCRLINHIIKGERAWIERIREIEWNKDLWQIENKDELLALAADNTAFLKGIDEVRLAQRITVVRLNGQRYEPLIADIVNHIFLHGAHHRGQLAANAAARGLAVPESDYMTYCIVRGL